MRIYRIGQITGYIKGLMEEDDLLQDLWLEGEISNWRPYPSGHIYFSLKDEAAAINAVLWRPYAAALAFRPRDGDSVLAHGYISVYEARGTYQLYVDELRPAGAGLQALELERLKKQLAAEGLFEAARKRPLPPYPRRLGVVTSPAGAAWRDICRVLSRRYPLVEVRLAPTAVQGAEAPEQIIAALRLLGERGAVDAVILARGGGSAEDLWAFNDEGVARAIAASPVPVIVGVGHEIDWTLADLVADVRAPTPSAAAEVAVPDRSELLALVAQRRAALVAALNTRFAQARQQWAREREALRRASPQGLINNGRQRLDGLHDRLLMAAQHGLALRLAHLQAAQARLMSLSPLATLERGYALVSRQEDGRIVRSVQQAKPGVALRVRVADGEFPARAEEAFHRPSMV
ncbi:MAG: exodeoxyribonuclease VII large subunit [Anaerolineae bacterium]